MAAELLLLVLYEKIILSSGNVLTVNFKAHQDTYEHAELFYSVFIVIFFGP
jgi:hypothetical protein